MRAVTTKPTKKENGDAEEEVIGNSEIFVLFPCFPKVNHVIPAKYGREAGSLVTSLLI